MAAKKKSTTKKSSNSNDVNITSTVGASGKNSLVGQKISINLKKESIFGVGPIWLTPKNYWCEIPDDLTPEEYATISMGLKLGKIVKGKEFIPPVDRDESVLENWYRRIKQFGLSNKNNRDVKELRSDLKYLILSGKDKNWTAKEIAEYCLQREAEGANRREVIRQLTQVVVNSGDTSKVWEEPDEEPGIISRGENEKDTNKSESESDALGQVIN